jgi:hypothetical protein
MTEEKFLRKHHRKVLAELMKASLVVYLPVPQDLSSRRSEMIVSLCKAGF